MPWINKGMCTGCGICVGKYIKAINFKNKVNQKSIEKLEAIKKDLE